MSAPEWLFALDPDCGCCEDCETLFSDDFERAVSTDLGANWEEVSPDWEITAPSGLGKCAVSSDAGAEILTVQDDFPPRFIGFVQFFMLAGSPGANDYFCKFRYIFGWEDEDNYWAVELDGKRTDALFSDSYRANVSIYRIVAGVESQIGGTIEAIVGAMENGSDAVRLWVCASDELVHWEINSGGSFQNYSYPLPASLPDESRHGLAIVTCDADTELQVLMFSVSRHVEKAFEPASLGASVSGQCECVKYCPACRDSIFPDQWRVVIAGLVDVAPNHLSQCNGTYFFPGKQCDGTQEINCALRDGGHPTLGVVDRITFTLLDAVAPYQALVTLYNRTGSEEVVWRIVFEDYPLDCLTTSIELEPVQSLGRAPLAAIENSTATIENAAL